MCPVDLADEPGFPKHISDRLTDKKLTIMVRQLDNQVPACVQFHLEIKSLGVYFMTAIKDSSSMSHKVQTWVLYFYYKEYIIVGMGQYEKYVHREVANAKLYRFRDSRVLVHPKQTWTVPHNDIAIKVPKCTKYGLKCIISSHFWFLSNILSFPSIICVDKRD